MAIYAIGDIQGCYDQLQQLLEKVGFNPRADTLWLTGDLVNRGPKSLQVLRFVSQLPKVVCVLGNHDFTLLALAYTDLCAKHPTLDDILAAHDKEELLTWLRHQPLLYQDNSLKKILVHAGIPPQWSLANASQYAREVEQCLQGNQFIELLKNMFGNEPKSWSDSLSGWERYRFIINALTRLRFCDREGNLDLSYKGTLDSAPQHLKPWFKFQLSDIDDNKILFGHWAALGGKADVSHVIPLDTGCFWGGALTALRLDDEEKFEVQCQ